MLQRIARASAHYPKTILILWTVILITAVMFSGKLADQLTVGGFSAPGSESAVADETIKSNFKDISAQRIILVVEHPAIAVSDPRYKQLIMDLEKLAASKSEVKNTQSAISSNMPQLLQEEDHRAYIYVNLDVNDKEALKFTGNFKKEMQSVQAKHDAEFKVLLSGGPGIYADILKTSKETVSKVERIGLPIVFILLLFVFRSVIASLLPLIVGVFSIMITMAIVYGLTFFMELNTLLSNIVTMLGFGVAIDYALFITQRFREELAEGKTKQDAASIAVQTAGRSVLFAGLTIAVTLISLLIPNTLLFRSVAIGGVVVVIVSIFVSISLLPAVLTLLGHRVDWLRISIKRNSRSSSKASIWERLIHSLMKRTVLYLVIGLVIASAAVPLVGKMNLHVPVAAYNELPEDSEARQGMNAIVEDFDVGSTFPILMLLEAKEGTMYDKEHLDELYRLTSSLKEADGIKTVRGISTLSEQLPNADIASSVFRNPEALPKELKNVLPSFVNQAEDKTIIYVIPDGEPNSEAARSLVRKLREQVLPKYDLFESSVTGETAMGIDYDDKIVKEFPIIIAVSLILTFVLLLIAFRSILLPIKAILLNGLVTASVLGILVYLFQEGHMPGTTAQALNVNTPVLLFCILFGLSIDYEVIIVSRMREHYLRTGKTEQSIVQGFVSTASLINGAASIMIAVFGVFVFAEIQIVQELGVGLAIAILMDAILIRTVVVPLSMKLLGRYNWWMPGAKKATVADYNDSRVRRRSL